MMKNSVPDSHATRNRSEAGRSPYSHAKIRSSNPAGALATKPPMVCCPCPYGGSPPQSTPNGVASASDGWRRSSSTGAAVASAVGKRAAYNVGSRPAGVERQARASILNERFHRTIVYTAARRDVPQVGIGNPGGRPGTATGSSTSKHSSESLPSSLWVSA